MDVVGAYGDEGVPIRAMAEVVVVGGTRARFGGGAAGLVIVWRSVVFRGSTKRAGWQPPHPALPCFISALSRNTTTALNMYGLIRY